MEPPTPEHPAASLGQNEGRYSCRASQGGITSWLLPMPLCMEPALPAATCPGQQTLSSPLGLSPLSLSGQCWADFPLALHLLSPHSQPCLYSCPRSQPRSPSSCPRAASRAGWLSTCPSGHSLQLNAALPRPGSLPLGSSPPETHWVEPVPALPRPPTPPFNAPCSHTAPRENKPRRRELPLLLAGEHPEMAQRWVGA